MKTTKIIIIIIITLMGLNSFSQTIGDFFNYKYSSSSTMRPTIVGGFTGYDRFLSKDSSVTDGSVELGLGLMLLDNESGRLLTTKWTSAHAFLTGEYLGYRKTKTIKNSDTTSIINYGGLNNPFRINLGLNANTGVLLFILPICISGTATLSSDFTGIQSKLSIGMGIKLITLEFGKIYCLSQNTYSQNSGNTSDITNIQLRFFIPYKEQN